MLPQGVLDRLEGLDRITRVVALVVVLTVVVTTVYALWPDPPRKRLVAEFDAAVGLYEGSDVRVLGVPIGTVDAVEPHGASVRVEMSYDASYQVPADAKAAVVAPSIVSDRYVQLTPAYQGGKELPDGATLALEDTAVPVELDRILGSLDDLAVALGPQGANADGALSELIRTGAANLDGQGEQLHTTIGDLADSLGTLSDGRDDLFAVVRQLDEFTTALADADGTVAEFNRDLATVADQLAGERQDLRLALEHLALALTDVSGFVRDNREHLRSNVEGLTELSAILVDQRAALAEILENAPVALANLDEAYNPVTGTLDTRNNFAQLDDPGIFLCSLLDQLDGATGVDRLDEACDPLSDILDRLPDLPPVPGGPARATPRDLTMGGILPESAEEDR